MIRRGFLSGLTILLSGCLETFAPKSPPGQSVDPAPVDDDGEITVNELRTIFESKFDVVEFTRASGSDAHVGIEGMSWNRLDGLEIINIYTEAVESGFDMDLYAWEADSFGEYEVVYRIELEEAKQINAGEASSMDLFTNVDRRYL